MFIKVFFPPPRILWAKPKSWSVMPGWPSQTQWVCPPSMETLPRPCFPPPAPPLRSPSVCGQPAVLPESSEHPDGEVPAQPPRGQQHAGGKLQQPSLAEERGAARFPRPAEGLWRIPDLLRREIPQPGGRRFNCP